jgi:hypothetical protein
MDRRNSLAALLGAAFGLGVARFVDLALIGGSLATAVGAVGFAGYMTMSGEHRPYVNGMKYLAIFAQPSHAARDAGKPATLDMNPVGAVAQDAETEVAGYGLVGAKTSYAWLRAGDRIFAVRPGDDVPRLGHVASIEKRDGRWALIGDKGAPLIVSPFAALEPAESRRFDRRMIFSDEK